MRSWINPCYCVETAVDPQEPRLMTPPISNGTDGGTEVGSPNVAARTAVTSGTSMTEKGIVFWTGADPKYNQQMIQEKEVFGLDWLFASPRSC